MNEIMPMPFTGNYAFYFGQSRLNKGSVRGTIIFKIQNYELQIIEFENLKNKIKNLWMTGAEQILQKNFVSDIIEI